MILTRLKRYSQMIKENPYIVFDRFNFTKIQRILPDELLFKIMFHAKLGYKLDLKSPRTFNEKLQWLKLYDRKPIYTKMVDKYEAKKIISNKVGDKYVVPSYGVWDSFDDIDFSDLPEQFVLKTTHDCGGVIICKNKDSADLHSMKRFFNARMKENFFWRGREWPYKDVKPRILAEKYLNADDINDGLFTYDIGINKGITDYKIMCFSGIPYCCLACLGRNSREGLHENFYDKEWNLLPFKRENPRFEGEVKRPQYYDEMWSIAEILSKGTKFLRVDFFISNNQLYVGELTFFPANGFGKFIPMEWDYKLGELIQLGENDE